MSSEHDYPETPQSRGEEYLQYICEQLGEGGGEHDYPETPQSRGEEYLQYICEQLGEGGGGLTPEQLAQLNAATAGLQTLNAEIDYIHPLSITEFRVSPNLLEKGEPYTGSIVAYWGVSRQGVDVTVDGDSAAASPVAIPVVGMTQNRTFTMTATKNGVTKTASASVEFVPPVFWGTSKTYEATSAQIGSLANKVITKSRARTISVVSGAGDYVLYALPKSLGTPKFAVGPLTGGFQKIGGDIQFDKYGTVYNLYRSDNANLGSISITVS